MSDQLDAAPLTRGSALPPGQRWRSTRVALHLEVDLSFDEWVRIGRQVGMLADSSAWWIGDWLVFGQHVYGHRYKAAISGTGLDYQTLRNYAWVASSFPVSRRRDTLSFGHHAEVASLVEEDQEAWLRRSIVEGWSRNELRRRLRAARAGAPDSARPASIELEVPAQRRARWEAAASAEGRALAEWIEQVLDRAADSVLERPLAA
jgi:hypothetical protein